MRVAIVILLAGSLAARAAIIGTEPSGVNPSYTYRPFDPYSPSGVNQNYFDRARPLIPANGNGVIRFMSWGQTPANPITDWSQRSTYDEAPTGATYETMVKFANAMGARVWANSPGMTNAAYAGNMGEIFGKSNASEIYFEDGNEWWNGGDQMQGTWNLLQARNDPRYSGDDTTRMAQRAWDRGFDKYVAFEAKARAAGYKGLVTWVAPGFVANQYFAINGIEFFKQKRGINLADYRVRIGVADYAPGSPTDITWSANDPPTKTMDTVMAFQKNVVHGWIKSNKDVAAYYGLLGIAVYEANAFSMYYGGKYWVDLNHNPAIKDNMRAFVQDVLDTATAGDPDAPVSGFGIGGNPWHPDFGTWDMYSSMTGPLATEYKEQGYAAYIADNSSSVPEPRNVLLIVAAAAWLGTRERRAA